jgi:hypothetical protein
VAEQTLNLGAPHRDATTVWDVAGGKRLWQAPIPKNSHFGRFAFASDADVIMYAPRAGTIPPNDPLEKHARPLLLFDTAKGPASERVATIEVTRARQLAFST